MAALLCSGSRLDADDVTFGDEQVRDAVRRLGSDAYAERQTATDWLWRAGPAVTPYLRAVLDHDDPEVRSRAAEIIERFRYGLFATTPPSHVRLIREFQQGNDIARREAMMELADQGAIDTVLALIETEANPRVRAECEPAVGRAVMARVPTLIMEGKRDEVSAFLERAARFDEAIRHWAAWLALTGQLDDVLARRSRAPTTALEYRQLAFLWRAAGRRDKAIEAARHVSSELTAELLLETSDWEGLVDLLARHPEAVNYFSDLPSEQLAYEAVFLRRAGREAEAAKRIERLIAAAGLQRGSSWYDAELLLINECWDEAVDVLLRDHPSVAFDLLCAQERYEKAFGVAGVSYPHGLSTAWFQTVADQAKSRGLHHEDRFRLAVRAARLLAQLGEAAAARGAFQQLGAAVAEDRSGERLRQLCDAELRSGFVDLALEHGAASLAKDTRPMALSLLFPKSADLAQHWWEWMEREQPDDTVAQRLQTLRLLLGGPGTEELRAPDKARLEEWLREAETKAARRSGDERDRWWLTIGRTWQHRRYLTEALRCFERAGVNDAAAALAAGDLLASQDRWSDAADWYGKAWQFDRQKALPLYLHGASLIRSGRAKEGNAWISKARLLPLASSIRHEMAQGLEERGFAEEALEQWRWILRTGPFRDRQVLEAAKQVGNELSGRDPLAAAEYWDRLVLSCLSRDAAFVYLRGYIQMPHLIHKRRAQAFIAQGQTPEAMKEIRLALQAWPGNVSLAEDLVPLLDQAGYREQADELFHSSYDGMARVCDHFPNSARHFNNLAWMAARCNRRLDEALKLAQHAVQLKPDEPTYLDTLAEVYFRLGDRERAIRYGERCVELDPDDPHFQQQLNRFRGATESSP